VELSRFRVAALLAAVATGAAVPPRGVAAQQTPWRIASMRMTAALDPDDGSADVSMRWTLVAGEPGAPLPLDAPVPIELLGFGDAKVEEVTEAGAGTVVLWPTHGSHRAAAIEPPFGASGGALELALSYRAEAVVTGEGASVRVRIPVLTGPPIAGGEPGAVDLATLEAAGLGPVGFSVALEVPPSWRVADGFPSGLRRGDDEALRATLSVSPSMVGFRARTDGSWRPGFPLLIDALTLVILLAFALRGWFHLRGVVSDRREDPVRPASVGPAIASEADA
jgi:hypothetical protein